jgi:hypothetical protein
MTHSKLREVRREVINNLKIPYSNITLTFMRMRLRDKDDEIRKLVYKKLI